MKALFLICIVLSLNAYSEMISRSKVLMGTFATISLERSDSRLFRTTFEILHRIESSLSSYQLNSPIFLLNKNKKADINLYTYEALLLSLKYYKQSGGYFNIAMGSMTKDLYHFGEDEQVPESWELNASNISLSSLRFDKKTASIGQGVKLDLGGMGKGFGVDRAIDLLKINGVKHARVALSGDIRCLDICKIEINNPNATAPLMRFYTNKNEMGVSTSGNYNRFVKTTVNNHLINPKTKESQKNFVSLTLISTLSNSDLDAYATAASVMPKELAYKFLDSLSLAYIVLQSDDKLVVSANIDYFVRILE